MTSVTPPAPSHGRRHRLESRYEPRRAWLLGLVVDNDGWITNASCVDVQIRMDDEAWEVGAAVARLDRTERRRSRSMGRGNRQPTAGARGT